MPQVFGTNSVLHLLPATGASVDLTSDLTSITLRWDRANPDTTTFGTTNTVKRIAGLRDYVLDFAGIFNTGVSASGFSSALACAMGASENTLFKFAPAGCVAGCPFYTGCGMVGNMTITTTPTAMVGLSFTLQAGAGSLSASTV